MKIRLDDIFLIHKGQLAFGLFVFGLFLGILGSLQPIYMWKFASTYSILASIPILLSLWLSRTITQPIFTRTDFIKPLIAYIFAQILMKLVAGSNINSYVELCFNIIIMYALFSIDLNLLQKTSNIICKAIGAFLAISLLVYFLYILGYPLPNASIAHPTLDYTYISYPFLLVDDRQFMVLIPRFNSVCLEPGHLGTLGSLLLLSQIGQWKKWYNIIILVATIFSFSLAAYVLIVLILFIIAWTKGKNILPSIFAICAFMVTIGIGATFYNDGDNLVNELILSRLEVEDDGNISGNNRVTDEFQAEYDKFVLTSDIFLGRGNSLEKFGFGNAGYKVFLYDYGLITAIFIIAFYILAILPSKNHRAKIGTFIVFLAGFWVRAIPLYYYFFVPLYIFAYTDKNRYNLPSKEDDTTESKLDENLLNNQKVQQDGESINQK